MMNFACFCEFDVGEWVIEGNGEIYIRRCHNQQYYNNNSPLDIHPNQCYTITMTLKTLLSKLDLYKGNLIIKTQDANILYNSRVLNSSYDKYLNNQVIRVYIDFELNTCYVYIYL